MSNINSSIYEFIISKVPANQVYIDEPMSKHTTFRVGGNADIFVKISDTDQLRELIKCFKRASVPFFIKGNGSNILVSDRGYQGVVLEIAELFNEITIEGTTVKVCSGALMSTVSKKVMEAGLKGMEFASGIPGTIGGGVVMNAGAYGGELKDIVTEVYVLNEDGEILRLDNKAMEFGYRSSVIKNRSLVVLSVSLSLARGDIAQIKATMDDLTQKRVSKQPLEYPSAGSTFKRPDGYFAGKLIMDTGLRGYTLGGAAVSEKHCGFVINKGQATATDIYELIQEIQDKVKVKFDVNLEPEVIFLGDF